jgi:catechol 2,3-dioxygenase-like lactoylglutathione lyase family enzyme
MIIGIHHSALSVRSLSAAAAFMRAAHGMAMAEGAPADTHAQLRALIGPDARGDGAFMRAPNCYMELVAIERPDPGEPVYRPVNQAGPTHICLQSPDMGQLYARFASAGATFHAEPLSLGAGPTYCYARDPEQQVVELESLPYAPPGQPTWVAHIALATPQIGRMAAFYHGLLGGERLGGQKIGPNPRFDQITALPDVELIPTWIVGQNVSVELWEFVHPPTVGESRGPAALGYHHICLEVSDLAAAAARCTELGARSCTPPLSDGRALTAFLHDPDGNLLELMQLLPGQGGWSVEQLPDRAIVARVAALRP